EQGALTGLRLRIEPLHSRRPPMATKTSSSARKTPARKTTVRKAAARKTATSRTAAAQPDTQAVTTAPEASPSQAPQATEGAAPPRAKKSVALSGVVAGNTALCTVGRTGNDLHYRGYDILDIADACEFEEVAHLLIHGKLPNKPELKAYKKKLSSLRGLPAQVQAALEALPASSHPMDVMRTAASAMGCVLPEKDD